MGLLANFTVAVLLLASALSTCLYLSTHGDRLVRSVYATQSKTKAREMLVFNNPAKAQNSSDETGGGRPGGSREPDIPRDSKCTTAPESRFDCGRDRVLSQRQCEERGCCYAPLPDSAGPPWCFYPTLYPGYKMGPFTPTTRGQAATLTRTTSSYLPRDIPTLHLEVIEETAGCLHLTVSTQYSVSTAIIYDEDWQIQEENRLCEGVFPLFFVSHMIISESYFPSQSCSGG